MTRHRRSTPPAARPIGFGAFAATFLGVLALGGALIGGAWWWRTRALPTTTAPSIATRVDATAAAPRSAVVFDPLTGVTPDGEPRLGMASAPVEVIEYADYQCPNCRQFATDVLPVIMDTWIRTGFVKIVYRDFIVFGADSLRAAEAAHCAGEQGRYWRFHDGMFALRKAGDPLDVAHMESLARALGLNVDAFTACAASDRYRARVEATTQSAKDQGFKGTPTYLINGRKVAGAIPPEQWDELFRLYQQDLSRGERP